jgi:hypothetical protein
MLFGNLLRKPKKKAAAQTAVVVYDVPDANAPNAAAVKGREVAIWRPPVMLDPQGRTMPGVSKDLVAHYLVNTVKVLADADLGPVTVEWMAQEGRFVKTQFTIQAWGQQVQVVHPVAPVSQELADALKLYVTGIALKIRELHRGHQKFGRANDMLARASRGLTRLRDADRPHFGDAEFLFLQTEIFRAQVVSALIPVGQAAAEEVVGEAMLVQ